MFSTVNLSRYGHFSDRKSPLCDRRFFYFLSMIIPAPRSPWYLYFTKQMTHHHLCIHIYIFSTLYMLALKGSTLIHKLYLTAQKSNPRQAQLNAQANSLQYTSRILAETGRAIECSAFLFAPHIYTYIYIYMYHVLCMNLYV